MPWLRSRLARVYALALGFNPDTGEYMLKKEHNPDTVMAISNEPGVKDLSLTARRAFAKAIQAERNGSPPEIINGYLDEAISHSR